MLRNFVLVIAFLLTISSCNNTANKPPAKKIISDYNFSIPKNWQTESINLPPDFAPDISYTGVEELRFAPGWQFTTSDEHWAYTFLWWLDGNPNIDDSILQNNLESYFTGLIKRNVSGRHYIPAGKVMPTIAKIKTIKTAQNDSITYEGTVTMTDYLDIMGTPITLNCLIHKKSCGKHTAMIFEISPNPFDNKIWQTLNKVNDDFTCEK
jgi:hypothetical protein